MKQLLIKPEIHECSNFNEFVMSFGLNQDDLILTNRYIYTPLIEKEKLSCTVIFQETYGVGEPTDVMVQGILKDVNKTNCRRVIAVGGGTIIDIAKVLVLDGGEAVDELYANMPELTKKRELIIIPTTCGTGSEVTNIAILNRTGLGTKQGLVSASMYADYAVLIPEFLDSLPYKVFATSSIDALVHAVESYLSPLATPFTEMYSEKAIEAILQGYCRIAKNGPDSWKADRALYLRASTYAGIAFGNSGCAAVHAMSYALGGKYHVPHGESNYQFFVEVLNVYQEKNPQGKIAKMNTRMISVLHSEGYTEETGRERGIEMLEKLLNRVLEKKSMADYGAVAGDIAEFTKSTIKNQQRLLKNNYIELTSQEIQSIYQKCL